MDKVLFFFNADNSGIRGGSESILRQICNYFRAQNSDVYILFRNERQFGGWDGMEDERLHLLYGGNVLRLLKNIWYLHKITFEYSFSTFTNYTGLLGLLKRLGILKINCMVGRESTNIFDWYHGFGLLVKKMFYNLGYPAVDILVCQTSYMKERVLQNLPWLEKSMRVVVAPNPVDLSLYKDKASEFVDTESYKPYIVAAGRFIEEKAYDILIDAFSILHKGYTDVNLVILGEGPLMPDIQKKVEELGLTNSVCLYGYAENVFPFFRSAELCVISSRLEGFPNVLLQMMSQNEKVVSTLCAGDIDKIKGLFTCSVNDEEALAKSMMDCLKADTSKNRNLFDEELRSRSIESFMKKIL